jgi:radical SAM/Cys-rich protein
VGRILPTLHKRRAPLASSDEQWRILRAVQLERSFDEAMASVGSFPLRPTGIEILQINVGKRCNQTCRHCHVDAGPDRDEVMTDAVVDRCLEVLQTSGIGTLDITGGAPELHPRFREIVTRARASGAHVMDRCNLTILLLPNFWDLPEFFAAHRVEIVASLPHYRARQTDTQRGEGVFEESIEALRRLNTFGYGDPESGLMLDLVTNPVGAFLPGNQLALEHDWKREMQRRWGIRFNRLFTITNMPIARYLEWLEASGNLHDYMRRLADAFNPAAAAAVMCRNTLSVGWDGTLYDCDFNQMLDAPVESGAPRTIFDFDHDALERRAVVTGAHCFGCTAGAGSSCGGATVADEAA